MNINIISYFKAARLEMNILDDLKWTEMIWPIIRLKVFRAPINIVHYNKMLPDT